MTYSNTVNWRTENPISIVLSFYFWFFFWIHDVRARFRITCMKTFVVCLTERWRLSRLQMLAIAYNMRMAQEQPLRSTRALSSSVFAFITPHSASLCFLNICTGRDTPTPGWWRMQTEFPELWLHSIPNELPNNHLSETENVTWTLPEWHHFTFFFFYFLRKCCQEFRQHCLRMLVLVPLHSQPHKVASMNQHGERSRDWLYTALCLHARQGGRNESHNNWMGR